MPLTGSETKATPAESRNGLGNLLKLLQGAQTPAAGKRGAGSAALASLAKRSAALALEEGPRGNAARHALRLILEGFQELGDLLKETAE
ncbi:MAG: hypothetical protein ACRD4R_12985 [Candidatus Acidiferrales bacterium]